MLPRKQDYALKGANGPRSRSVMNFKTVKSSSVRHGSAVLPSVLTFAVIVASGGLLLMIEKGMLNSMETPPPRGTGPRAGEPAQGRAHGPGVDADFQVCVCVLPVLIFCWFQWSDPPRENPEAQVTLLGYLLTLLPCYLSSVTQFTSYPWGQQLCIQ